MEHMEFTDRLVSAMESIMGGFEHIRMMMPQAAGLGTLIAQGRAHIAALREEVTARAEADEKEAPADAVPEGEVPADASANKANAEAMAAGMAQH